VRYDRRRFGFALGIAVFSGLLRVQAAAETYSLSGRVSDTESHTVPSATVSARRLRDGKVFTARTNSDGVYTIPDLEPGDYSVWARAGELAAQPVKVTLAAGQTTDLVLSPSAKTVKR
jgi:hypothetical protein